MSFSLESFQVGDLITGKIIKVEPTGVLVDIGDLYALLPTSKMSHPSVDHPNQFFKINDHLKAAIIKLDPENGQVVLESCGSSV